MDILRTIRELYTSFSKTQRRIADFLLENSNRVAFMTLKSLSEEVCAAEVTILKFCKLIGCSNFMDLKKEFQINVNEFSQRTERLTNILSNMESVDNNLAKIMESEISTVESAIRNIRIDDIEQATSLIRGADKVYLVSEGISDAVTQFLMFRLKYVGINVEEFKINSYNLMNFSLSIKSQESVFIVTTLPTYSKKSTRFTKYLKENNYNIIAMTDSIKSPVSKYASVLFICDTRSALFFNTITGLISVSNMLVTFLAYEQKDKILESMKELEKLEEAFFMP